MPSNASLLAPYGYQSASCGYCKRSRTSASYYAQTSRLLPEDYQALIDRGWRRSGTLLYKPDIRLGCCPHHTIRLEAAAFSPRRDQKAALHRWNRFVLGEACVRDLNLRRSRGEKQRSRNEFDLLTAIHAAERDRLPAGAQPEHQLEVRLETDDFSEEKFALYVDYQTHVHGDAPADVTRQGFKRFLCRSPLVRSDDGRFGSFHQTYRLDGELVAMSVLDLLPHAVSGVYFMYADKVARWHLGKVSAVREAGLAMEGGYGFYYMGYYIHGCAKMRYKAEYGPQNVLDLETMQWRPLVETLGGGSQDMRDGSNKGDDRGDAMDEVQDENGEKIPNDGRSGDGVNADADKNGDLQLDRDSKGRLIFPNLTAATAALAEGLSLFELAFPGTLSAAEVREQIELDAVKITLRNKVVRLDDLYDPDRDMMKPLSLRGVVANLAACVGPEVAQRMVVDL
ncbi:arginyl-tRNA-protein transferase 1 [Trichodelitschia bisporula]|uniref:Arginyl-tRNA--protein transferase 1 n=1 Tax=Trichodelitschia bisporula TaxID=703511 RepID=A0A6G1HWF4_9PEZI|nr:arginyl-tRNA-protein transferase 1 [Trichodelitschia bisporula]